jgi:curved DNA-binding protein CbpA
MSEDDPYKVLEVAPSATDDEIKHAYRSAAKIKHPHRPTGSAEEFRKIAEAYELLSDPGRKAEYDRLHAPNVFIKSNFRRARSNASPPSPPPVRHPIAAFTISPRELDVSVDASATTSDPRSVTPLSFTWTWGDGSPPETTTSPTHSHRYTSPDDYTITLTATNSAGLDTMPLSLS